jgi:hypothetical protein
MSRSGVATVIVSWIPQAKKNPAAHVCTLNSISGVGLVESEPNDSSERAKMG